MNKRSRSSWLLAAVLAGSLAVPFAFVACGDSSSGAPVASEDLSSSEMLAESSSSQESAKPLSSSAKISASSSSVKSESSSSEKLAASSSAKFTESSSNRASSSSSEKAAESSSSEKPAESSDSGVCTNCDSYTAADPMLVENGGKGSVTTYGSITAKETSLGGACNYGQTNIRYYAAIHVNVSPGG